MKIFTLEKRVVRKLVGTFFCAVLSMSFFSCGSTDETERLYASINYSQEDVVRDEIRAVESLAKKNPVEALWRSTVLVENAPDISGTAEVFADCENLVVDLYKSSLAEKKYLDAIRLYESLVAAGSKKVSALEKSPSELSALVESSMPIEKYLAQNQKASQMIKGTVTIFVDKGIKIEGGVGYKDTVLGSGFFITRDGFIITNHHVISDCVDPTYNGYARLYIKLAEDPDTRIPARVVGYDRTMDLALIKTEVDAPYIFTFGTSSDLEIGDKIYVMGSPLGLDRTLTGGIVSATDRDLLSLGKVFQIDAAVSPGNSGGPMIDDQGRVQAVVFAGVQNYQGLNFAIPVEYLKAELAFLFGGGKRTHGWMEAFGKTRRMVGSGAKNEGVEILYVMPGGKASFAGLREGDVITAIDGSPIDSVDALHLYLLGKMDGTIVRVTAENSETGSKKTFPVYLSSRPENPGYTFYTHDLISSALYPILGMELVRSSTTNKKLYTVSKVIKNSSADTAGFSEGDPVQILQCEPSDDKSVLQVGIYTKNKKKGFIDYGMTLGAVLDGSLYF